jgi:hypothetical protein
VIIATLVVDSTFDSFGFQQLLGLHGQLRAAYRRPTQTVHLWISYRHMFFIVKVRDMHTYNYASESLY